MNGTITACRTGPFVLSWLIVSLACGPEGAAANAVTLPKIRKNSLRLDDKVDAYVLAEMEKQTIPGMAIAVLRGGKVIKAEGYGWADVEKRISVKPTTVFQIQSVTKSFTAAAIMLLVDEGRIALDDKMAEYFDRVPAAWSNITVRHLLTHTSGIKDFINEPTMDLTRETTPEEIFESLQNRPLNFLTGEKYSYSNTGYQLLGMIIQKATGTPWHEFVRERILAPLRMTDTRLVRVGDADTRVARGYRWTNGRLTNGLPIAQSILGYPGGGLVSTVRDLAKWDAGLYGETPLKQALLAQMWTPARFNDGKLSTYGFGFGIGQFRGLKRVSHNGGHVTGFTSTFMRLVDENLTVIVLTNQRRANTDALANGIAAFYLRPQPAATTALTTNAAPATNRPVLNSGKSR